MYMNKREIKLVTEELCDELNSTNKDITDFAKLTAHGDLEDCGIVVDQDLYLFGTYNAYILDKKEVVPSVPGFKHRCTSSRDALTSDSFIKPMFKLTDEEVNNIKDNGMPVFEAPQTLLGEGYQDKLDELYKENKLVPVSTHSLINKNTKYNIGIFENDGRRYASVPNSILRNDKKAGHSWFLVSEVVGSIYSIDGEYWFVPDKVLFSGMSFINIKKFINSGLSEMVRKRNN